VWMLSPGNVFWGEWVVQVSLLRPGFSGIGVASPGGVVLCIWS
jgi:hypothetical protein